MVPKSNLSEHQKLSKIATLRLAIHYISALTATLKSTGATLQPIKAAAGVGDRRGRRRGRGGRKRKLPESSLPPASSSYGGAAAEPPAPNITFARRQTPAMVPSSYLRAKADPSFPSASLGGPRYSHDSHHHPGKHDYSPDFTGVGGGFSPTVEGPVEGQGSPAGGGSTYGGPLTAGRFFRVGSQGSVSPGSLQGGYSSSGSCHGEGRTSPEGAGSGTSSPGADGVGEREHALFFTEQFRAGGPPVSATFCVL